MHSPKPFCLTSILLAAFTILSLFSTQTATAQNRLFASVSEFTGSTTAPRFVAEVDIAGQSATTLFNVPAPPISSSSFERTRDLVVDEAGNVLLYNGTFTPSLLAGNAVDGVVSQLQTPEFSTVANTTFGGIARDGNFVYLTDQSTGGSPGQGILRIDITDNSFTRFASTIGPRDLDIGPDGVIYAIGGTNSVFRYDSETLSLIDVVPVSFNDHRAVAGLADGTFLTATSDGDIFHYNSNGTLLNDATVVGAFFADIDIAPDGQVALGTAQDGEVVLTTVALDSFDRFRITESTIGGNTFVAFATDFSVVPEPSSGVLFLTIGICWVSRRRRLA